MQILSYWRAKHVGSLNYITSILYDEALQIDNNAIVAKRLKRSQSIVRKLRRFNTMKLRNMQDIAGCRAIFSKQKYVDKARRVLNKNQDYKVTDYTKNPKNDGYRGIHLICKSTDKISKDTYPVEIQLRTKVQHSWATAVEIVDLFTNQQLKLNNGEQDWLDFFKYVSCGFSHLEGNNEDDIEQSLAMSIKLSKKLNIHKKFKVFAESIKILETSSDVIQSGSNLLIINLESKTIEIKNYPDEDFEIATQDYLINEQIAANTTNYIVALVSLESINGLKEAYPNYFADSKLFLKHMKALEVLYKIQNPSQIFKFFKKFLFENKET